MEMVLRAVQFAAKRHKGQFRMKSGAPYASHPVAVSYLVAAFKHSKKLEEILAATVLHDVLEDTPTRFEELSRKFTPLVASLVLELSNDDEQIKEVGKLEYQTKKMLGMSSYGLVIKLADRYHNISDSPSENMVQDTLVLMQRLRSGRILSKTHLALVTAIEAECAKALAKFKKVA